MYARFGPRVLLVGIAAATIVAGVSGAASSIELFDYLGVTSGRYAPTLLWAVPLCLAACLVGLWPSRGILRPILAWSHAEHAATTAAETWVAVMRLPRAIATCMATALVAAISTIAYIVAHFHIAAWAFATLLVWILLLSVAVLVVISFGITHLMRPLVLELDGHLPAGFASPVQGLSLRLKTLTPLPLITCSAMLAVGAIATAVKPGPGRFTLVVAVSLVAVAIASAIFALVIRSLLDPVEDLIAAARRVAVDDLGRRVPITSTDELGALVHDFNAMLADLRERRTLLAELLASRARVATAVDAERRRMERDLQSGPRRRLEGAAARLELIDTAGAAGVEYLRAEVQLALAELRELAHGIFPVLLANDGLQAALEEAVRRAGVPAELLWEGGGREPAAVEAAIYFCALEALGNVRTHAGPGAHARVHLRRDEAGLHLVVSDDGRGVNPGAGATGTGIVTMGDRIGALGGTLSVQRRPEGGTRLSASVPLTGPKARTAPGGPPRARSGALAARVYRWLGARVLVVGLVAGTGVALFTGVVAGLCLVRYLHLPAAPFARGAAFWAAFSLALLAAGLRPARHDLRRILAWRDGDARAGWTALVGLPRRLAHAAGVCGIGLAGSLVWVAIRFHEPAWALITMLITQATATLPALYVQFSFIAEYFTRPLLADMAAELPRDFAPKLGRVSFTTKALAPLPVLAIYGTVAVGAFSDLVPNGPGRLSLVLTVALVALAAATVLFAIIAQSVLDPVAELRAGTQRVRSGDLETPVPLMSADELGLLTRAFNEMLAGLRERAALRTQLRESRARIVGTGDAERRRLERDLHDGSQQHLVTLGLKLGLLQRLMVSDRGAAEAIAGELEQDFATALDQLRDLAQGIYPALLAEGGLHAALGVAVARAGLPVRLECETRRFGAEIEAAVYFCCLEGLQNAAKHAGSGASATLMVAEQAGVLRFTLADDGRGYDAAAAGDSGGLQNLADRVSALGGTVQLDSSPGEGAVIRGEVPLRSS